jgi:hypothetical protein
MRDRYQTRSCPGTGRDRTDSPNRCVRTARRARRRENDQRVAGQPRIDQALRCAPSVSVGQEPRLRMTVGGSSDRGAMDIRSPTAFWRLTARPVTGPRSKPYKRLCSSNCRTTEGMMRSQCSRHFERLPLRWITLVITDLLARFEYRRDESAGSRPLPIPCCRPPRRIQQPVWPVCRLIPGPGQDTLLPAMLYSF